MILYGIMTWFNDAVKYDVGKSLITGFWKNNKNSLSSLPFFIRDLEPVLIDSLIVKNKVKYYVKVNSEKFLIDLFQNIDLKFNENQI